MHLVTKERLMGALPSDDLSDEEITRRMDGAIRRALNTPPSPTKSLVGKTDRAQSQRESRALKKGKEKR